MKKVLLIIALAGFTAVGSYAQNKGCFYKHKATKKVAVKPVITPLLPLQDKVQKCVLTLSKLPCDGIYDNAWSLNYNASSSFTGNYPGPAEAKTHISAVAVKRLNPEPTDRMNVIADRPVEPCYSYTQHDIMVSSCPDVFYDRDGSRLDNNGLDVRSDNDYMGYYPVPAEIMLPKPKVPENTNDENPNSPTPGDNLCYYNCK